MMNQVSNFSAYISTAYHAVKGCEILEGQWLAVVGCGGLGHLGKEIMTCL